MTLRIHSQFTQDLTEGAGISGNEPPKTWPWVLCAVAIFIAAITFQILLIYPVHELPDDSDTVLGGICGLNVLHGSHPLMFPGMNRFGAQGCYFAAGTFSLLGVSRSSLRLVSLAYFAVFLLFIYLYLREAFGVKFALPGLVLAAIPPAGFFPNYGALLACCAGMFWLAEVLVTRKPRAGWYFAFGALSGLALWFSTFSLVILLPIWGWLLLQRIVNSALKALVLLSGAIAGSLPMWIFLARGGISTWVGDPHMHAAHTSTQLLSNASYLFFTLIPWFFTNREPGGHFLLSLSGVVLLVYVVGVLFVLAAPFNSKLRERRAVISQVTLFLLVIGCFCGLFIISSAGSLRDGSIRYIAPLYIIIPGIAAFICKLAGKTGLILVSIGTCFLVFVNAAGYSLPGSSAKRAEQAALIAERQLVQRLERAHVQLVLGGYWDVYNLNFDSEERLIAIPIEPGPDYFDFTRYLSGRSMTWALVDQSRSHLSEWQRRLRASGEIATLPGGRYLFVSNQKTQDAVTLLREARIADGPPPLSSFAQMITSSVRRLESKQGRTYMIRINVTNTGTEPWFADGTADWVDLSYRWFDTNGRMLPIEGNRTHLSQPEILPGKSEALELKVTVVPKPGSYTLYVSMVQEGVAWFFQRGAKPLIIHVDVH